jgi:hypothetical protein
MIGRQLLSLNIFWSVKLVMLLLATVSEPFPHKVRNRHHFKQIQQSEPI